MKRKSMYRNIGGKRIHVNQLAAHSRQFTVSNNAIPKVGLNEKNIVTMFKEIRTTKFDTPVLGKMFEIDKDGHYHLIEIDHSWKHERHKQPKHLVKCKKRKYSNVKSYAPNPKDEKFKEIKREKRNDFVTYFPKYPYNLPKMNQTQYMEKLVEHKLAKWERKNPCPMDMFTEDVEKWKQLRENMKMHFRDVVVSIYDKLKIVGNYVDVEKKKVEKKVVATIKDIDGKGHNVDHPALSTNHKLYKSAVSAATKAMKRDHAIVDCDLKNHKGDQTRPLLITRSDIRKAA